MHISQLYVYPVKSLGGIPLQQAAVTARGLEHDRRYMLIDEQGTFLSQRSIRELALFKTGMHDQGFSIRFGMEQVVLPVTMQGPRVEVSVWDDRVSAVLAADQHHQWFSDLLQKNVRLVYMDGQSERPVNPKYADNSEQVSFADAYPVLLISEASLSLLNSRLAQPVGMDRFRPNIVVSGMEPHGEDHLTYFTLNNLRFKAARPCARCVVTTIDQETGLAGKEPLATLARYRLADNKINFGENVICLEEGMVAVGDALH